MSDLTRRAVLVGAAAVAAAAIVPTAAEAMTSAGPSNPLPPGWIHCDWRVEISENEFPLLYRVLLEGMFPPGSWLWEDFPERIALPRFQFYQPWHCWSDMLIIKASFPPDETWPGTIGTVAIWRLRGP